MVEIILITTAWSMLLGIIWANLKKENEEFVYYVLGLFFIVIGWGICIGIYTQAIDPKYNPLDGTHLSKYHREQVVIIPDSTVGEIKAVYYQVEDSLYLESTLKLKQ